MSEIISYDGINELLEGLYEDETEQPKKAIELLEKYIEIMKMTIERMEKRIKDKEDRGDGLLESEKRQKGLSVREDIKFMKQREANIKGAERIVLMIKKDFDMDG